MESSKMEGELLHLKNSAGEGVKCFAGEKNLEGILNYMLTFNLFRNRITMKFTWLFS